MKKKLTKILFITIILTMFLITISATSAAEHNITNSTDGGLNRIVTNANSEDTINLAEGIYNNNVTNITIDKNITLIGKNPETTIIDAEKLGRIFNITSKGYLTLINITLTNGYVNGSGVNGHGGIIYNNGSLTIDKCIFMDNNASEFGGAINNQAGNLIIKDSTFKNNWGDDGSAIASVFGYINITNTSFINNNGGFGGAIRSAGAGSELYVKNCSFINNKGYAGGAINNNGDSYAKIIDCIFINNTGTIGGAIINAGLFDIINSTFINNTANYGGVIYNEEDMNVIGCNIFNNSNAIMNTYNGIINLNYNRIFNNTNYDIVNYVTANADYNWWGTNNLDMTKIINLELNNYFVMNVVNLTSLDSNGTVTFKYTFKLNNSQNADNALLPYFVTKVYTNHSNNVYTSFDARFNKTFDVTLNTNGDVLYIFIDDNEVQTLNGKISIPAKITNLTVDNSEGENGETVILTAKLTDENGNPIANKEVKFHIAGELFTTTTNSEGIATIQYTINKSNFKNNKLTFTVTFEGNESYLSSNAVGSITLTTEPEPTPDPDNNKTKNNTTNTNRTTTNKVDATMKTTGLPVNLILVLFLGLISFGYYGKQ